MKSRFYFLILILAIMCLAGTSAVAQQYSATDWSITNTLAGSATTTANLGDPIKLATHRDCAVVLTIQGDDTGTDNVVFNFKRSPDGTIVETSPLISVTVAQNNTTQVVYWYQFTEAQLASAPYLVLASVANGSSADMTNVTMTVVRKNFP